MENLNDLIWTDEENEDGIQPQGTPISIACMSGVCMDAFCGGKGSAVTCIGTANITTGCCH